MEKGILVTNAVYSIDDVADQAVAFMLSLGRRILSSNAAVRSGRWDWKNHRPIKRLRPRLASSGLAMSASKSPTECNPSEHG